MTTGSGRFLVVEGPDGAGKSSLVAALAARMREAGHEPVVVREPGGTNAAEALRRELLDKTRHFEPLEELLYITAARADLINHVIRPGLESGRTVLSDRFELSTFAYQVAGRGIDGGVAEIFNKAATGGLKPDLTLVLDVPASVGMERQIAAGKRQDRLDLESPVFQERVVAAYMAASGPGVRHLNGALDRNSVMQAAWLIIQEQWPDIFQAGREGPRSKPRAVQQ
ncbi:MAG: dTMP kinase [Gemmatimonadota bacterium]